MSIASAWQTLFGDPWAIQTDLDALSLSSANEWHRRQVQIFISNQKNATIGLVAEFKI